MPETPVGNITFSLSGHRFEMSAPDLRVVLSPQQIHATAKKEGAAEENAACAELARAAGCLCRELRYAWTQDAAPRLHFRWAGRFEREAVVRDMGGIIVHDPRCPAAILAAIEARG